MAHLKRKSNSFARKSVVMAHSVDNMRNTISNMLMEMGFDEVLQAKTGPEALLQINKNKADIVIADYHLTKINGLELLKQVRTRKLLARIPFVIVSAELEEREIRQALKWGLSEYVAIPFCSNTLRDKIDRAFLAPVKSFPAIKPKESPKDSSLLSSRPNILIVDDDPKTIDLIGNTLKNDYSVRVSMDCQKALKICNSENSPDLILLNLANTGAKGLTLCQTLKSPPILEDVGIILLADVNATDEIQRGLKLGALDFCTTPIVQELIKLKVDHHIRQLKDNQVKQLQINNIIKNKKLVQELIGVFQADLKTPLTEMEKEIRYVQQQRKNPARIQVACDNLLQSRELMLTCIENFSLLQEIKDGSYQLCAEPTCIATICNEIVAGNATGILSKNLEIQKESLTSQLVLGEYRLLRSLIWNLFKTAVDIAPRGSMIKLILDSGSNSNNLTHLLIHCHGMASANILNSIKTNSIVRDETKNMAIYAAKVIAELQQGYVRIRVSKSHRTTFQVTLPSAQVNNLILDSNNQQEYESTIFG